MPRLELRIVSRSRDYLIAEIGAAPEIENGKVLRLFGFARDVTERKNMETALRESELAYRHLFENAIDGILIYEPENGTILEANNKACEVFGFGKGDLVGRSLWKLANNLDGFESSILETLLTGECKNFETVQLRKDGTEVILLVSNSVPDYRGKKVISAICHDVTDRKRAQEALRASEHRSRSLFERNLSGICRTSLGGRILDCNDSFAQMFGYETRQELMDAGALALYARSEDRQAFLAKLQTQRALNNVELSLKRKDGSSVYILGNVSLVGEEGRPEIVEGIWMDITERKMSEEELRRSRQRLRALSTRLQTIREEERMGIAREIHDQLGQSMTRLKIDLAMLTDELPVDSQLLEKTASMSKLVDSTLLIMRKISSQLRPPALDDLGLTAAIEVELSEFQHRTGIQCDFVATPEDLILDRERSTTVFRILQEALTNVVRHAKATRVEARLKKEESYIELTVCDNGTGIPSNEVFSPQSLGLTGMRERALQWGGELEIGRVGGSGTRIQLLIPFSRMAE